MDLEAALSDPAYDLPMPPDGLALVRRQAARIRRRRQLAVALPAVAVLAALVPLAFSGGPGRAVLYGSQSATPEPTQSPEPLPQHRPASEQLQTFCVLPAGGALAGGTDLIGPTGDPIDNCSRFWRYARHDEPPALVAFQDKYNNVYVQRKADPLPEGAVLLPAGVIQPAEAIVLNEALGDLIELGPGHCRTRQQALEDATVVVGRVGFADWPVRVDDSHTDPSKVDCWSFAAVPRRHEVTVTAVGTGFDYPAALEDIAKPLRASLTGCWSRSKALSEVHAAVQASSLKPEFKDGVYIREVDEPNRRCTVIRMGGGGGIEFTLRGPA